MQGKEQKKLPKRWNRISPIHHSTSKQSPPDSTTPSGGKRRRPCFRFLQPWRIASDVGGHSDASRPTKLEHRPMPHSSYPGSRKSPSPDWPWADVKSPQGNSQSGSAAAASPAGTLHKLHHSPHMKAAKPDAMSDRTALFDARDTLFGNTPPTNPPAPARAGMLTKARDIHDDAVRSMRRKESLVRGLEGTGEAIRELREMIARLRSAVSSASQGGRTPHDA